MSPLEDGNSSLPFEFKSRGKLLDLSADCFGELVPWENQGAAQAELESHVREHGYFYIRDFFPRDQVLAVRQAICEMLAEDNQLDLSQDLSNCAIKPELIHRPDDQKGSTSYDRISAECQPLHDLIYGEIPHMFFERLLGGKPRHYDQTWFRAVPPGFGTVPHCDVVYMGRGTHNLYTCWTPFGDISFKLGGLMVLEGSHHDLVQQKLKTYLTRDVDDYCNNRPLPAHVDLNSETDNKVWNGWLARNPVTLRNNLGGRWLTTEYRAGDVLIFSCKLVHASLDNQSQQFRLSSDCRYQLASDPIDERFVGEGPFGHVGTAKRGKVC